MLSCYHVFRVRCVTKGYLSDIENQQLLAQNQPIDVRTSSPANQVDVLSNNRTDLGQQSQRSQNDNQVFSKMLVDLATSPVEQNREELNLGNFNDFKIEKNAGDVYQLNN